MSSARLLSRARSRRWAERALAVEALALLLVARFAVSHVPFRMTARVLGLHVRGRGGPPSPSAARRSAQVACAVGAAARLLPWTSTCLVRAVAGAAMLRLRGIPGTLELGVAKDSVEAIAAHAWLSCGDSVLLGAAGSERFTPVATYAL